MIADRIRRTMQTLLLVELFSLCAAFAFCYFSFYNYISMSPASLPYKPQNLMFFFISGFTASICASFAHFFFEFRNFVNYANSSILMYFRTSIITLVLIWSVGMLAGFFLFSGGATYICFVFLLAACMLDLPLSLLVIRLVRKAYSSPLHQLNVLVAGINRRSIRFAEQLTANTQLGFSLAGFVDDDNAALVNPAQYLGRTDNIEDVLKNNKVNLILLFLPVRTYYDTCSKIAHVAEKYGIPTQSAGDIFDRPAHQFALFELTDFGEAIFNPQSKAQMGIFLRRGADLCAALALMLLFCIPFLAIAGHIYFRGGHPVLLGQDMVGLRKRVFRRYKFRTHIIDPDDPASGLPLVRPEAEDNKLISCGGLIRALHLDSMPYLFNVALGNMTFFGPKPLPLEEFKKLPADEKKRRAGLKPGIIGR